MEAMQTARKLYQRSYHPAGVLQQFLAILCTGSLLQLDKQIQQPTLLFMDHKIGYFRQVMVKLLPKQFQMPNLN
jgi:hypothetical protein